MFARNLAAFTLVALIQFVVPLIGFSILRITYFVRFVCSGSRVLYLLLEFISVLCSLNHFLQLARSLLLYHIHGSV